MKRCSKCFQEMQLSEFSRDKKTRDGFQYVCKRCQSLLFKINYKNRKDKGVEKIRSKANAIRQREKRRIFRNEIISLLGGECKKCGYKKSSCSLDFHHVNPDEKSSGVSILIWFLKMHEAKEEADKTVLLCANCHRELENNEWSAVFIKSEFGYSIVDVIEKVNSELLNT